MLGLVLVLVLLLVGLVVLSSLPFSLAHSLLLFDAFLGGIAFVLIDYASR